MKNLCFCRSHSHSNGRIVHGGRGEVVSLLQDDVLPVLRHLTSSGKATIESLQADFGVKNALGLNKGEVPGHSQQNPSIGASGWFGFGFAPLVLGFFNHQAANPSHQAGS